MNCAKLIRLQHNMLLISTQQNSEDNDHSIQLTVLIYIPCALMTFTVVEDELRVTVSWQITSVSFTPVSLFAGLVTSLVISGRVFVGETLEKVNKTELIISCTGAWLGPLLRSRLPYLTAVISPSRIPKMLHSTWLPVMLHVSSSWSPSHTGAIPGEDIIAKPIVKG